MGLNLFFLFLEAYVPHGHWTCSPSLYPLSPGVAASLAVSLEKTAFISKHGLAELEPESLLWM